MAKEQEVTDEQANQALQQLLNGESGSEVAGAETQEAKTEEPTAQQAVPTEEPSQQALPLDDDAQQAPVENDDVESLRQRTSELQEQLQAEEQRFQQRLQALQERSSANEKILRDRFLQKANALDKARRVLMATRSETGVSEAEVDAAIREMESTMNPDSPSYSPPVTPVADMAEKELILNAFLNEKQLTTEEANEFGRWIQIDAATAMSPTEQAVAAQSLDGFLRLAYHRYQEGVREKEKQARRNDAVGAVKSVQQTQKAAARAASTSAPAPRRTPAPPSDEVDVSKLTPEDVSDLLRQTMEMYR